MIGQHYRKVVTPATAALAEERERRFLAGEKLPSSTFEAELVHKDGSIVPVEARTRVNRDAAGKPIGYQGIYRDITERQRLQAALQQSEARYRLVFDSCPDLIYVTDTAGQILDANPALIQWAGFSLEELRRKHFLDFYVAGDASQEDVLRSFAELLHGQPVRELVVKAKNARGEVRDYEVNAIPLRAESQDTITSVLSIARDITARRETEEALRESQRLRERIADTIPELVYIYDLGATRTRLVNRQVTTVLGYTPEEVQGKTGPLCGELLHPNDVAAFVQRVQELTRVRAGEFLAD